MDEATPVAPQVGPETPGPARVEKDASKIPGARPEQPWPIRVTHWLNVPLIVIMAGSGLQIFMAYPFMGPRGAEYRWWPFQDLAKHTGLVIPTWLRLGGWLAGARALHFAAMWALVANGLVYLAYVVASREWRRRAFQPKRDTRNAIETGLYYARIRKNAPAQGFYNGLQRLGYTSAIVFGVVLVLSGLALWKPVQLAFIAALFGGYDGARLVHFLTLFALVGFVAGHLLMVLLHPRTFITMITGGAKREATDQ